MKQPIKGIEKIEAGIFRVKSGKVVVSDPCYDRDVWCKGIIEDVRNGEYKAKIICSDNTGGWGKRCFYLIAHLDSFPYPFHDNPLWEKESFEVGVDSGQAGIYDEAEYKGGEDDYGDGGWYDQNCNLTSDIENKTLRLGGVLSGGVVSSSGCGDGGYDCYTIKKDGQVVAIMIDYGMDNVQVGEDEEEETCEHCGDPESVVGSINSNGFCNDCQGELDEDVQNAQEDLDLID